jgi:[acyl-carrier-protein] S-malonyltransferase
MTLAYLFGSGIGEKPSGASLYDHYPLMRKWLDQVRQWTGVTPEQIFTTDNEREDAAGAVPRVRSAALAIGVHDLLADAGVHPQLLGGASLGGMISSCLAGAVDREELFGLLVRLGEAPGPPEGSPPQGVAVAYVPANADNLDWYYGAGRDGVHLACEIGTTVDGTMRALMLSGYREALERLVAEAPPGQVFVTQYTWAFHSPLQQFLTDHMRPYFETTGFRDPVVPICSPFEPGLLTTADQIRDVFVRNATDRVSLEAVEAEMHRRRVSLAIVPGPSLPAGVLKHPFPVVHVETPEHLSDAMTAIYELGVELTPAASTGEAVRQRG